MISNNCYIQRKRDFTSRETLMSLTLRSGTTKNFNHMLTTAATSNAALYCDTINKEPCGMIFIGDVNVSVVARMRLQLISDTWLRDQQGIEMSANACASQSWIKS